MSKAPQDPVERAWWLFWCFLCEQWCEQSGPWCELYANHTRTENCYFKDYPERAAGVRWPADMPPHNWTWEE